MLWGTDMWGEMERLRREMNDLFSGYGRATGATTYPLMNVYDTNEATVVTAELPGVPKDKVSIEFADGVLTLTGTRAAPDSVKNMTMARRERSEGAFEKSVRIPTKINQDAISASFSNGILTITLPKSEEAKPRTIKVEAK